MIEPAVEGEPIDAIADEFLNRYRRGETPSIEEYARRHPELADEIRDLLPTVAELEGLKRRHEQLEPPPDSRRALPVERLGDFRLIREIGRGGMGIVYEAEQESLGRRVAVKVLPKQSLLNPRQLARFEREARTAAKLHHTHIVPVFGVGEDGGYHFIVMQLIPGVGLDEVIDEIRRIEGDEPLGDAPPDESLGDDRPAGSVARSLLAGKSTDDFAVASTNFSTARTLPSGARKPPAARETGDKTIVTPVEPLPRDFDSAEDSAAAGIPSDGGRVPGRILGRDYWQNVARIGRDAADALDYAHHQGTLHRDVKPGNLLVDAHGSVWVADFGVAKMLEGDEVSQPGDLVGTLRYMSPEQLRSEADVRSDVYSLGLTLYELVTLRPAFARTSCREALARDGHFGDAVSPRKLVPHIPRDLETIILKAIAPEPQRRYTTAGEMAADLDRFLNDVPIHARRISTAERLWRWSRRNQGIAFLSAVSLMLLITVAVVSSIGYVQTESALSLAEDRFQDEQAQRKRVEDERRRAEGTLATSLQALDAVYRRFAPERRMVELDSAPLQDGDDGPAPASPVLAPENAKFLEEILEYYDKLATHGSRNPKLREEAAKANRRLGDIQRRLGSFPRAEAAYQRASLKYTELLLHTDKDGTRRRIAFELARIDNDLGEVHRAQRKHFDALRSFDSARRRLLKLNGQTDAPEVRFELARTYLFLAVRSAGTQGGGDLPGGPAGKPPRGGDERGGPNGFRKSFGPRPDHPPRFRPGNDRTAGPPRIKFPGKRPGKREFGVPPDAERFFGPQRRRPFRPFGREHDDPESRKYLDKAVGILELLHRDYPRVGDYQHLLAIALRERGGAPDSLDYKRAVQLLEDLARQHPQQPDYQFALIETWSRASDPFFDMTAADVQHAEQRLRQAVKSAEQLTARHVNVPDYAHSHATAAHRLAVVLERKMRTAASLVERRPLAQEAESLYRTAVAIQSRLVARFPDAFPYVAWLAKFRMMHARFLVTRGRVAEAKDELAALEALRDKTPAEHPGRRFLDGGLRAVYFLLADRLHRNGEGDAARQFLQKARALRGGPPR